MLKASRLMRWIALSILFGGSASILYTALAFIRAAGPGLARIIAAGANAPLFYQFSTLALVAAFVLVVAESLDYAAHRSPSRLEIARYVTSLLCAAGAMVFALGLVPPMKKLWLMVPTSPQAYLVFHQYHKNATLVFGGMLVFALTSIVLPAFDPKETERSAA